MERLVDARGLACPQPVINTKRALEGGQASSPLVQSHCRDNVLRVRSLAGPRQRERKTWLPIRIERKGQKSPPARRMIRKRR